MRYDRIILVLLILVLLAAWGNDAFAAIKIPELSDTAKQTLAKAANNIVKDLGGASGPFYTMFRAFTFLAGLVMIITAIRGLTRQDTPKGGAIAAILVGTMLISLPTFLNMFSQTMFEADAQSIISEAGDVGTSQMSMTTKAFIRFSIFMVQVIGFVAVYRGLKTLADIGLTHQRQPQQVRAAWIYLFAGVICINILGTLKVIATTAAGASAPEILNWYNQIFGNLM